MANKIKYSKSKRNQVIRLYKQGRTEGGEYTDGTRYNSKGKYTLREISEKTGVHYSSVYKIARGLR